jgi:hypothetical protein
MTRHHTMIRFLMPLYLAVLVLAVPAIWLSSSAMRSALDRKKHYSARRKWLAMLLLGRHGANSLGFFLPAWMIVSAVLAGYALGSGAAAVGAFLGLVAFAMVPVLMPLPSSSLVR